MSVELIRKSAADKRLIVVLGSGATVSLMNGDRSAPTWNTLVGNGLQYVSDRQLITAQQLERYKDALSSDDLDDLLGVSEFVSRKLGAPNGEDYARWMNSVFEHLSPAKGAMSNALAALQSHEIPLATLNYDTTAEQATDLGTIDFVDTDGMLRWMRREQTGILHLHGTWKNPKGCIFSIRDYESTLNDEIRNLVQRSLGALNRLLFIGCGNTFSDPNFSFLIEWLRSKIGSSALQHFALVRDQDVAAKLADSSWKGFVEPIGFGDDYADLPGFMLDCFPTKKLQSQRQRDRQLSAASNAGVKDAYRRFILRDCGEMTIEGMRADIDTAQRRFDLERLFVPLDLRPSPPAFPANDPDRSEKLQRWRSDNDKLIPFSDVFKLNKRIALLALPGGGKTLLLKRVAVAYANPARRALTPDNLPTMQLFPLMVRCREWKDHITKPIRTLFENIDSITGDPKTKGLFNSIEQDLKSGRVVLLVDGLDEIHNDADRSVFVENLEKFLSVYPKIRMIVTSREAGFDLVAPDIARFCEKFKISPLSNDAIVALCEHWHRLMGGGTPEAMLEATTVSSALLGNESLQRLAENPLLLTMLLVVKHSNGRLPPDRVSLYDRAVEVLLDTWNIKGHEALNIKEAVPQLACLAFELLSRGKQTAVEAEILGILEEARKHIPMVSRYAKDTPQQFLKRVELRSSLMLEGGHTREDDKVVAFYQFRHLTFQEYLAAVAAVNGYTLANASVATPLDVLNDHLKSDEWKEVVPMAASLGKSHAAPLLRQLLKQTEAETKRLLVRSATTDNDSFSSPGLTRSASTLASAMVEEASVPNDIIGAVSTQLAIQAHGCGSDDFWPALCRGPYAADLRKAALDLYVSDPFSNQTLVRNTVAMMEGYAKASDYWQQYACVGDLLVGLRSDDEREISRSLLSMCGSFWLNRGNTSVASNHALYDVAEQYLHSSCDHIRLAAFWAWGFWRLVRLDADQENPAPLAATVPILVSWMLESDGMMASISAFCLARCVGLPRNSLERVLSKSEKAKIRKIMKAKDSYYRRSVLDQSAVARVAFICQDQFSDKEISEYISGPSFSSDGNREINDMRSFFGLLPVTGNPQFRRSKPFE